MITVACDGGLVGTNPSKLGGSYAWIHIGESGNSVAHASGIVTPEFLRITPVTNNHTELIAMLFAIENLPEGWSGAVLCDSYVTIRRVFYGGTMKNVPGWLVERVGAVMRRIDRVKCRPVLLDGHPTKDELARGRGKRGHMVSPFNVFCDRACQARAREFFEQRAAAMVGGEK